MSRIATRSSTSWKAAASMASQTEPSETSESPSSTNVRAAGAVEAHRERHAEPDREALTQRTGRDIDPGQLGHRSRVTLDRGAESTQGEQLLVGDCADRLEHRVQGRRRGPSTSRTDRSPATSGPRRRSGGGSNTARRADERRTATTSGGPIPPPSCSGCCRRRSARRGRSRAGCGRPSSPPVNGDGRVPVRELADRGRPMFDGARPPGHEDRSGAVVLAASRRSTFIETASAPSARRAAERRARSCAGQLPDRGPSGGHGRDSFELYRNRYPS